MTPLPSTRRASKRLSSVGVEPTVVALVSDSDSDVQIIDVQSKKRKKSISSSPIIPVAFTASVPVIAALKSPAVVASTSARGTRAGSAVLQKMFAPAARAASHFRWHAKLGTQSSCLHGTHLRPTGSIKIAAFDIDGTLILTKGRGPFATSSDDWRIWSDLVVPKLKAAYDDGFAIVLISNQCYKGKRLAWFETKLPNLAVVLDVPFHVFAANVQDGFRKPDIGMWTHYAAQCNDGVAIDMAQSYYVGDAAGRKGDHSDSDKVMAANAGLQFFTPEQYFM